MPHLRHGRDDVRDASEVRALNRKQRNKMSVVKEGLEVTEVIIQEGVPTRENVVGGAAEPVVYMIDRYVVGGFYRVHTDRGPDQNLNAPGMHFVPLAFSNSCNLPDCTAQAGDSAPNCFYATRDCAPRVTGGRDRARKHGVAIARSTRTAAALAAAIAG